MGLGYRFIWYVWFGKYAEKRKHSIGHPRVVLNLLFGTMNSFKPYYVMGLDDSGAGGCTTFFLLFLGLFSIFYFIFKSNIGLKSKNNVLQNAMRYSKGEKRKKGLYETS
jgi:hypothetical protein